MEDENQKLVNEDQELTGVAVEKLAAPEAGDGQAGQPWTLCAERLPPDGVSVLTKIDDGKGVRNVQTLVRRGRLWFTGESGDAMYVYYTPTHWKPFASEQKGITTAR